MPYFARPLYVIPTGYPALRSQLQRDSSAVVYLRRHDDALLVFATSLPPEHTTPEMLKLADFAEQYVPTPEEVMRALRGPAGPPGPEGVAGAPCHCSHEGEE